MLFRVEYSSESEEHLRRLTAFQQVVVLDTVDEQLTHEPHIETRNRKPMRPNPVAPWELRIGELRVYYEFVTDPEPIVLVRAVGEKSHNRVTIGGKEVEL